MSKDQEKVREMRNQGRHTRNKQNSIIRNDDEETREMHSHEHVSENNDDE